MGRTSEEGLGWATAFEQKTSPGARWVRMRSSRSSLLRGARTVPALLGLRLGPLLLQFGQHRDRSLDAKKRLGEPRLLRLKLAQSFLAFLELGAKGCEALGHCGGHGDAFWGCTREMRKQTVHLRNTKTSITPVPLSRVPSALPMIVPARGVVVSDSVEADTARIACPETEEEVSRSPR